MKVYCIIFNANESQKVGLKIQVLQNLETLKKYCFIEFSVFLNFFQIKWPINPFQDMCVRINGYVYVDEIESQRMSFKSFSEGFILSNLFDFFSSSIFEIVVFCLALFN